MEEPQGGDNGEFHNVDLEAGEQEDEATGDTETEPDNTCILERRSARTAANKTRAVEVLRNRAQDGEDTHMTK